MSHLPSVKPKVIIATLKRSGFIEHHQKGSHLYLWHPIRKRMTSVAVHTKDLPRGTVRAIIEQAGFTEEEFQKLL